MATELSHLSDVPKSFIPIPCTHPLEIKAWREPNGARFVHLVDESEETWVRYCDDLQARTKANFERVRADRRARNKQAFYRLFRPSNNQPKEI